MPPWNSSDRFGARDPVHDRDDGFAVDFLDVIFAVQRALVAQGEGADRAVRLDLLRQGVGGPDRLFLTPLHPGGDGDRSARQLQGLAPQVEGRHLLVGGQVEHGGAEGVAVDLGRAVAEHIDRHAAVGRIGQAGTADDLAVGRGDRVDRQQPVGLDTVVGPESQGVAVAAPLVVGVPRPAAAQVALQPADHAIGLVLGLQRGVAGVVVGAADGQGGHVILRHQRLHRGGQEGVVSLDDQVAGVAGLLRIAAAL